MRLMAGMTLERATAGVLVASIVVIAAALAFEHIGGYKPCPLCLQQRYAYYFAIPASLLGLLVMRGNLRMVGGVLLALVGVGYLINAGLGGYHAGVEWGWWPGPTACAGGAGELSTNAEGLLGSLEKAEVIRCDEPALHILGLSFAGWNAVISLALAAFSFQALATSTETPA